MSGKPTRSKEETLQLFAGLPRRYDLAGALLSFGQDPRWRRAMVRQVRARPGDRVLDVATGTGMVAAALVRRYGCSVVGLDQSPEMLAGRPGEARRRPGGSQSTIELVRGEAESLPFADGEFDHLTFTYLLRYVEDPGATLRELARVVKPGGRIASLEFMLPPNALARALWRLYTRAFMPGLGRLISRDWYEVGRFLGPSISESLRAAAARPPARALAGGRDRGRPCARDELRRRGRDLGQRVADADRAGAPGLLRPAPGRLARPGHGAPSAVHGLAPDQRRASARPRRPRSTPTASWRRSPPSSWRSGIGAHTLDELNGRPLETQLSDRTLIALAVVLARGSDRDRDRRLLHRLRDPRSRSWSAGGFFVVAYNLELFGGRFHTDFWLAAAWGGVPGAHLVVGEHPLFRLGEDGHRRRSWWRSDASASQPCSGASRRRSAGCGARRSRSAASSGWRTAP